jgi:hypothetical protein
LALEHALGIAANSSEPPREFRRTPGVSQAAMA